MSDNKHPERIDCVLIAAGKYHDIDFARLELLKLFGEDMRFRVRVFEDYENLDAIRNADCLVTYTCDVIPSLNAQEVLKDWLNKGGRWLALHGTNSILRMLDDGLWAAPRIAPLFMDLLGSQFITHPPIEPYLVTNAQPDHELVQGIESFETTDELYHLETHGTLDVLLETECTEEGTGFAEAADAPGKHPVFYIKTHGEGAVLYLTLGHCRGHYDLQPDVPWWPTVDRCAWDLPVFYTLLKRGISWINREKAEV
ncbi:MAG: ThuA domain-containing protein [Parvibaculales bacterium]